MKKFFGVIGNPPYQEQAPGESTSDKPIYHKFMDASYAVGEKVELVTPARFLFNAGGTPKNWNKKMLESEHMKVLFYAQRAQDVFPTTTFTGGIAVTLYDEVAEFEPIGRFTPYEELNSIRRKIVSRNDFESLSSIISKRNEYLFTEAMHADHPDAVERLSAGHPNDLASDIFDSLPDIFVEEEPDDIDNYLRVLGRFNNKRTYRWVPRNYIKERVPKNIGKWKVFLPKANGASGTLGDTPARIISKPLIGEPFDVAAETFVSVGAFDTKTEAESLMKYFDGRLSRALLGILKVTQDNTSEKWAYVPLQDFTSYSDVDWTMSPFDIDRQLYEKYGLSQTEIDFIESHIAPLREA